MVIYKLTQSVCTSSFFFKTPIFLLISFFLVTCCLLFTRKYRIHRCPSMPMNGQTFWNSNKAITVWFRSYIFVSRFLIWSFYSLSHIIKLILFKINILFFRNSMVVWQAIYFWNNIFYLCTPIHFKCFKYLYITSKNITFTKRILTEHLTGANQPGFEWCKV